MIAVTQQQQAVLDYIKLHITNCGFPPSRREIVAHFKFKSLHAAQGHIERLVDKGLLIVAPGIARGIKVVA